MAAGVSERLSTKLALAQRGRHDARQGKHERCRRRPAARGRRGKGRAQEDNSTFAWIGMNVRLAFSPAPVAGRDEFRKST
jgi:hypothetical protein